MAKTNKDWIKQALYKLACDFQRSADTQLIRLSLPEFDGIDFYLKDESMHPSGSLKHRLARSLFVYALCNGDIHQEMTIVEASAGNTAISVAYFAKLLGLPFIAVMPQSTTSEKIENIKFYGGECHLVDDPNLIYEEATRIASEKKGYYMDRFIYGERATDWRGNNNIAESIFEQMKLERYASPTWVVVAAGTGSTATTIGRYIRYQGLSTKLCVVDPENSVFFDYYKTGNRTLTLNKQSLIGGIGRPRVEPSFTVGVIDHMLKIPDHDSIKHMLMLSRLLERKVGGSTGTQFSGALQLAREMQKNEQRGSLVFLICDRGERYLNTYYNSDWREQRGFDDPSD